MNVDRKITRKQLDALPKDALVRIIRDMEATLVSLANANDDMSWRGTPEKTQMHFTRGVAFKFAAEKLQGFAYKACNPDPAYPRK